MSNSERVPSPHYQDNDLSPSGISINPNPTQDNANTPPEFHNEARENTNGEHDQFSESRSASHTDNLYHEAPERKDDRPINRNQGTTLFVSRLSYRTSEDSLFKEFSRFGKVLHCNIVLDPHTRESRGFGFVSFESPECADTAIEQSSELRLDGASLFVEKSHRNRPRSPTPGRYSGHRLVSDRRSDSHGDRRGPQHYSRDSFDRPPGRPAFDREYPSREFGYPPRDRVPVHSRYEPKGHIPDDRVPDREFHRGPPRGRDYHPRDDRDSVPSRVSRDSHVGGYPREHRDARELRGFRSPRESRDRFMDYPRVRDARPSEALPYDRERPSRPRVEHVPDRYRDNRENHYPPTRVVRDHQPRYGY